MRFFQRNRDRGVRRFEVGVEEMEGRRLLTGSGVTVVLSGTMLEIVGTNLGDTAW